MRYLLYGISIAIISCQSNESSRKRIAIDNKKSFKDKSIKTSFSVLDSLNKYTGTDSLYKSKPKQFYVGRINESNFAIVELTDTTSLLYQKLGNLWQLTDSLSHPLQIIKKEDLNGDGFKDIRLIYNVTGIGGNAENIVMIYYPAKHRFQHNKCFDLPNINYDKKTRLIHVAWWSGSVGLQRKMIYSLLGDSVVFKAGVTYEPVESTQGATATVEVYIMKGKRQVITKIIRDKTDKAFSVFENALWNSSDEF